MLMLLNRQLVAAEILTLARLKIASILIIPESAVIAQWVPGVGNMYQVEFGVNQRAAEGVDAESIRDVIGTVWGQELKPVLKMRLDGLDQLRPGKKYDSSKEEDSQAVS